jgi:hypothetical protein
MALLCHANAQDWSKLRDRRQLVTIEGLQVTILVRSEARFSDRPAGIQLNLRAGAGLDDLQAKTSDILRALAAKKSICEARWSLPQLSPATVQEGKLKVSGQVRVETWLCAGPLKTFIARETADFVIALQPLRADDEVAVTAELEHFDLGKSLLGGIGNELKKLLASALKQVFDSDAAKLKFPPEVASIKPRFTRADLVDAGDGKAELQVEAEAVIRAADMPKIMALIDK